MNGTKNAMTIFCSSI